MIPGAFALEQVAANLRLFAHPIPGDLWAELKHETLLREDAPVPADSAEGHVCQGVPTAIPLLLRTYVAPNYGDLEKNPTMGHNL